MTGQQAWRVRQSQSDLSNYAGGDKAAFEAWRAWKADGVQIGLHTRRHSGAATGDVAVTTAARCFTSTVR